MVFLPLCLAALDISPFRGDLDKADSSEVAPKPPLKGEVPSGARRRGKDLHNTAKVAVDLLVTAPICLILFFERQIDKKYV